MQFLAVTFFLAAASAAAVSSPSEMSVKPRTGRLVLRQTLAGLCPGIDSPVCCETDVDGIADLTCDPPSSVPGSTKEFIATCAESGLTAECCTLDVDGDGLICTTQEA